jgi:D-hydroxyproline dehydrogenase subunit gamma
MTGPYRLAPAHDPVAPADGGAIRLTVDGAPVTGRAGQTIAGVLLATGRLSWRPSPRSGRPRGVFCGIGVCFDCLIVVNGLRDVRACQRRAADGDVIDLQDDRDDPPGTVADRAVGGADGDRAARHERASAGDGR